VVNVDINVEDSLVVLQELENGNNYVIHVAEPTGFLLLGVVESASPVDADI